MNSFWLAEISAFWLGILTSISPCPLATNIAAVSFLGSKLGKLQHVLAAGVLYTMGRALAYVVLALLLVNSMLSMPSLSHWLQRYMNMLLGPVLIVAGMFLLEMLSFNMPAFHISERIRSKLGGGGLWSAFPLGAFFALALCPVSAALFFGGLIPLAVRHDSGVLLPLSYGTATGLPVLLFALLFAVSAKRVAAVFDAVQSFEIWARRITGVILIGVGIYFCLVYLFRVL